jgi:hypothetical protein
MELELIVTEWLRRIPEFELAPGYGSQISHRLFNAVNYSATGPFVLPSLALRWNEPASAGRPQIVRSSFDNSSN